MTLRGLLPHLERLWTVMELDSAAGVQLVDSSALVALHHPPFHPDSPALLALDRAVSLETLQRVLLNQYPAAHELRLIEVADKVLLTHALALEALAASSWQGDWAALLVPALPVASSFERFQETIAHLRAPEGCPWDRKQTHTSLRPYLLEETYEVLDALDSGSVDDLREELGDLLLQIVLHSQIAIDQGEFRMGDIIAAINAKLIHRHPHVWGEVNVRDEDDVKTNWDRLKQAEKQAKNDQDDEPPASRLDGVSRSLPALSQAYSYQDRAARVNFDWATIEPVIAKVREEMDEVLDAPDDDSRAAEMGDLLFAVVNWARWLKIDPESALRGTNARFYRRFRYIEQQAVAQHRHLDEMTLDEMDVLWEAAKSNGL